MGLAIGVGELAEVLEYDDAESTAAMREMYDYMNEVLAEYGVPAHNEPESFPVELNSRAEIQGFSYSCIHYLRRFYAHLQDDPDWTPEPVAEGERATDDPVIEEEMTMFSSHLLCHSDCEGHYAPIDFQEIVIDKTENERIVGGMLGSSYRLREELIEIAPALGVKLEDGELSDAEAERLNEEAETRDNFGIEKMVWLALYEAARLSIQYKTAIWFG